MSTCLACGTKITGPATKKFCNDACRQRLKRQQKKRQPKRDTPSQTEATAGTDAILRVIGDNLYLAALPDELEFLGRAKTAARAALEKTLRRAITENPIWPSHSLPGQCALLLWLLEHPGAEHGRFRHLFEKVKKPGEVKISGTLIHAGIGRVGTGT